VSEASRRTTSRRELSRHERFEQVSPEVGMVDEEALDDAMADDADEALALLADMAGATDEKLRALAKRLAGRLMVDLARRGSQRKRGIGAMRRLPYRPDAGDLDLDASAEPLLVARATGSVPDLDELRVRGWVRPGTALALLVDRSGSMGGKPLAASAVAAAAVAWRAPNDYSVSAFAADVVVAKAQDATKAAEAVVNDVLVLRGHGTTDLALALRTAQEQLARSRAARKVTVLLSDCRATVPGDVIGAARALDELWIVAPEGDSEEAEALAASVGARVVTLSGPSSVPDAFARLLDS
jgi:Mg-chelatase subunit ChlD